MKKTRNGKKIMWLSCGLLFLYFPIFMMVIFSFNDAKSLSRWNGFSIRWYQTLWQSPQILRAIFVSVSIAVLATIIAVILGTITAIGLSKNKKIVRNIILQVNNLPIINPEIVTAISLMLFFSLAGMNKGYVTLLIAHVVICTPLVITNVLPKVRQVDVFLADAAMDLGASPWQAMVKVILPQIKPGIIAGALLSFTMSFDDFIISYFVSGNGVENISILVYNMSKRTNPVIYALATVILVIILVCVIIGTIIVARKEKRSRKYG